LPERGRTRASALPARGGRCPCEGFEIQAPSQGPRPPRSVYLQIARASGCRGSRRLGRSGGAWRGRL